MKLTLEIAQHNLKILNEVLEEYPILKDYQNDKIRKETLNMVGLDNFISLIDFIKFWSNKGIQPIYDTNIKYKEIKNKIVELTHIEKVKKIFQNKSQNQFNQVYKNYALNRRYKNSRNQCYAPVLNEIEPLIFCYLVQQNIEVDNEYIFYYRDFWFNKLTKPKLYARELRTTQEFIDSFLDYAKSSNLDLRKCNVKSLTTELHFKLKELARIEIGLQVKCIEEINKFTPGKIYTVQESRINYQGFVEIKLEDDKRDDRYVAYSSFEEISRQREDILAQLGI